MNFYNNFEKLCMYNGVSPAEVGRKTEISKSSMSNWKKRNGKPTNANLKKLADFFNVSVDFLLNGEEKEKPTDKADELDNLLIEEFATLNKEEQEKLLKILSNPEKLRALLSLL